jgi:hypothetical protein
LRTPNRVAGKLKKKLAQAYTKMTKKDMGHFIGMPFYVTSCTEGFLNKIHNWSGILNPVDLPTNYEAS